MPDAEYGNWKRAGKQFQGRKFVKHVRVMLWGNRLSQSEEQLQADIIDGTWHHVVCSWNGEDDMESFCITDGEVKFSFTASGNMDLSGRVVVGQNASTLLADGTGYDGAQAWVAESQK